MNAGKMDRRIALLSPTITTTGTGEQTESFNQVAEVWAQFLDGKGKEGFENDQKKSITHASFVIRYRTDVRPNWEIFAEGNIRYEITAIQEVSIKGVSRHRYLALLSKRKY